MLPTGSLFSIIVTTLAYQSACAHGQPTAAPAIRNSSLSPPATYSLTVSPWTNHYQFPPVSLPIGTQLTFLWEDDDHGVFLLNNDQCPTNWTTGSSGQEVLYPVTTQTAGLSNYTTTLNSTGVYYFACQENTHCLQGQRLEVTVFNYTQGIPGSVTQYAPGPGSAATRELANGSTVPQTSEVSGR